jgi:hypothetical protein
MADTDAGWVRFAKLTSLGRYEYIRKAKLQI